MNNHCTPLSLIGRLENCAVVSVSWIKRCFLLASVMALAACASLRNPAEQTPQQAPAIVSLDEWMSRGDAAMTANDHAKARDAYRAAAKDYPTVKQPWLKLAEDYFNAQDYGNAVLAGQEVLQRDPHDRTAHSVLAVSGLRLTAGSLTALRNDGAYPVGSRDEALAVTRALREALGEPVLVPQAEAPSAPVRPKRPHRSGSGARATPSAGSASAPVVSPAATTPPVSRAPGNPLDKLK